MALDPPAASPRRLAATERAARQRVRRTTALLSAVLGVVLAASWLVYRGGLRSLEARADQKLEFEVDRAVTGVERRLKDLVAPLELIAGQEVMLDVFGEDPDFRIRLLLNLALERERAFTRIDCLSPAGTYFASTGMTAPGARERLPSDVEEFLAQGGRASVRQHADGFVVTVPIYYEFDEPELLGYLRAHARYTGLLVDSRVAVARLLSGDDVLAEVAEPTLRAEQGRLVPGRVHRWEDPELETRTRTVDAGARVSVPRWTVAIAHGSPELAFEAGVLRRLVAILTACTAALVVALILVFARTEAGLFRRLAERATELETLNARLDRSRADLAKAARVAGRSEIATGILHNVGNVLNSLNIAAQQVGSTLVGSKVKGLRQLVGFLERDEAGLRSALDAHAKGPFFVSYLTELTSSLEAENEAARGELATVTEQVEHIAVLVKSQQEFAQPSSVLEEARASDVLESALVLSRQALRVESEFEIVREFDETPVVRFDRHRAIEVLVNLINNALQALRAVSAAAPRLTLALEDAGDDRVRFRVTDNGDGIPEENLVRIFHHGFSTRAGGNGFGLHAAFNAAREAGGALTATSAGAGAGATFTLELPCEAPGAGTGDAREAAAPLPGAPRVSGAGAGLAGG